MNSDPKDLVFVPNVTTGVNTVLKGLKLEPKSKILYCNHTFPSTKLCIDQVATEYGADALSIDIPMPIESEEQIVELYHKVKLETFLRKLMESHYS